ncbi:hypothetical protein [Sorangium sp. So ce131]|uniref:hypothetical protein n=1 Tax=Sorangium sp. So ce131 TaxID=3133282 RepID=UPI003F5DAF5A
MSGLLSTAIAAPASAQSDAVAAAESLFNRGLADMLAGRYITGCPALTESHRLDPRPGRLFTLAECEAKWGRIATAVARYNDYLAMYSRMPEAEQFKHQKRYKIAREQRDTLAPQVPQLTLSLPKDAPAGTVVQRNGLTLAQPSLGIALPVDPGEHVVTAQAPGGPLTEARFTIGRSESKTIEIEVKPPVEEPPPERRADVPPKADVLLPREAGLPSGHRVSGPALAAPDAGPSGRRVVTYVAGGLAVTGLVVGSVTGWMALDASRLADEECSDLGDDVAACSPVGKDAGARAKDLGLVSTIGFSAGAVLAGTAVVLFLTEPSPSRPPASAVSWSLLAGPTGGSIVVSSPW